MFTSYFGNIKNLPKGQTVAISQGVPVWYKGKRYLKLAPTWQMIRIKEAEEYTKQYFDILAALQPAQVFAELKELAGTDAILLCWEKPGEFCHRSLVADWFKKHLGVEVPEYPQRQPALI